jgi:2OG-Fe(II) oxygenase superfamily
MLDPCTVQAERLATEPSPRWLERLGSHLALRCPGAIDRAECARHAAAVLTARPSWTAAFAGKQFTLGRAYYTHLEEDREDEYFAAAQASDALVRRAAPGLQETMLELAAIVLGGPLHQRPGWCGPGVHIFTNAGEVARRGGEVHFDTEGLTDAQVERRVPAVSIVLMLQPPTYGGGLRLWDRSYEGDDFPYKPGPDVPVSQIAYEPGELVVFDSYRMHQILPFRGGVDRISATMHACLDGGAWEAWF